MDPAPGGAAGETRREVLVGPSVPGHVRRRLLAYVGVMLLLLSARLGQPTPVLAAEGLIIRDLQAPVGVEMGETVTTALVIENVSGEWSDAAKVGVSLSSGLRPLLPPDPCDFDATAWALRCDVPSVAPGSNATVSFDAIATDIGFPSVTAILSGPAGKLASRSASVVVEPPPEIRRYAPEFRFHQSERYWPMSVDGFVGSSELRFARAGRPDDSVVALGEVRAEQLGLPGRGPVLAWDPTGRGGADGWLVWENTRPGGRPSFYQSPREPGSDEGFFLDLAEDARSGEADTTGDSVRFDDLPVYVQYRRGSPERGDGYIRYWVLYGCSSLTSRFEDPRVPDLDQWPLSCWHEGDWEGVAVRLDAETNEARQIAYFAHDVPPAPLAFVVDGPDRHHQVEVVDETHPVVYVAAGSHASYSRDEDHTSCVSAGGNDLCGTDFTGSAQRWRSWESPIRSAEGSWYGFGGAWGASGFLATQGPGLVGQDAVVGPGGPGLVDPLPSAWPDDARDGVARCDPGELHPESQPTLGTSCVLTDAERYMQPLLEGSCVPDRRGRPDGAIAAFDCAWRGHALVAGMSVSLLSQEDAHRAVAALAARVESETGEPCYSTGAEGAPMSYVLVEHGVPVPPHGDMMGMGIPNIGTGASEQWAEWVCDHRADGRASLTFQGPLCADRRLQFDEGRVEFPSLLIRVDGRSTEYGRLIKPTDLENYTDSWHLPGLANAWTGCEWVLTADGWIPHSELMTLESLSFWAEAPG